MVDLETARKMGDSFVRRCQIADKYKSVFGEGDGQEVLLDLLRRGGFFETAMVAGDPHMTSWKDGRRSLPLEILEILRFEPEAVIALAKKRDAASGEDA